MFRMTCLPRPIPRHSALSVAAVLAVALVLPAAAQASPGTFTLPAGTPTPAPTPAGPADERAGVAIPPRAAPEATPTSTPSPTATLPAQPSLTPTPSPSATRTATRTAAPAARPTTDSAQPRPGPVAAPVATSAPGANVAPAPLPGDGNAPITSPTGAQLTLPTLAPDTGSDAAETGTDTILAVPAWQLIAAGFGALLLIGGALFLRARRRPGVLRLAAPAAANPEAAAPDDARLDLALEITAATRSVMRFSLGYRLNIANRSDRAVLDVSVAVQLACARASGGSGPSAGAAQGLGTIARIGPQQTGSITGEVHLPLAAIQPLRQGTTPLFVPLVHVTVEGEGQRALTRTFVVGPRSASGRVHPIALDQPPGGIAGLVAQIVALPPATDASAAAA